MSDAFPESPAAARIAPDDSPIARNKIAGIETLGKPGLASRATIAVAPRSK